MTTKKARGRKTAKGKKGPALVTVKVDAGLKKRWDALSKVVQHARHAGAE